MLTLSFSLYIMKRNIGSFYNFRTIGVLREIVHNDCYSFTPLKATIKKERTKNLYKYAKILNSKSSGF